MDTQLASTWALRKKLWAAHHREYLEYLGKNDLKFSIRSFMEWCEERGYGGR